MGTHHTGHAFPREHIYSAYAPTGAPRSSPSDSEPPLAQTTARRSNLVPGASAKHSRLQCGLEALQYVNPGKVHPRFADHKLQDAGQHTGMQCAACAMDAGCHLQGEYRRVQYSRARARKRAGPYRTSRSSRLDRSLPGWPSAWANKLQTAAAAQPFARDWTSWRFVHKSVKARR